MEKKKIKIKIGIECHIKLKSKKKMFSPAKTSKQADIRDLAIPGCLPIINKKALELALKACLIFKSKINKNLIFDRKHYIYKDLPKGYQITQKRKPIGYDGQIKNNKNKIKIKKIQLEEDTANMKYKKLYTKIDYKRSGDPLLEIVTEPQIKNSQQAKEIVKLIKKKLKKYDISNCRANLGEIRTDVNISINYKNKSYKKVEIKNLNSCKKIINSIEYEVKAQIKKIKKNKTIKKETKKWDERERKTKKMRKKISTKYYKFIEDKNFPKYSIENKIIKKIKKKIDKIKVENKKYKKLINKKDLKILKKKNLLITLKKITKKNNSFKENLNFLINKLPIIKKKKINYNNLEKIINWYNEKKINNDEVKRFSNFFYSNIDINNYIDIKTNKNEEEIEKEIIKIIENYPEVLEKYKKGKENLINFLIGKVIEKIKINPEKIKEKIVKIIKK